MDKRNTDFILIQFFPSYSFTRDKADFANATFKSLSDAWFIIDIILNFFTAVPKDGYDSRTIEYDLHAIRSR